MVTMEISFLAFTERKSKPVLLAVGQPNGSSMMHGIYAWFALVMGHVVAQLVEALRYKPEGRGFDSRWCHWIFSLT